MYEPSEVISKKDRAVFDKVLRNNLFSNRSICFVFHEPGMLPLLLFWRLTYSILRSTSSTFVYDAHDLIELKVNKGFKHFVLFGFNKILLKTLSKLKGVNFITVSEGLQNIFETLYSVKFSLVYSIPAEFNYPVQFSHKRSNRLVYFGQINQDRISIDCVKSLVSEGFSIDLYGVFSERSNTHWNEELLGEIRKGGGEFRGRYDPNELEFLRLYTCSLMLFKPSTNIRYCMPNKLFQSLSQGVPVVVNSSLEEVTRVFSGTGAVVDIKQLRLGIEVDVHLLKKVMSTLICSSKVQFFDALGVKKV
jgi:hypothetical protein